MEIATFPRKTVRPQNGLLIFFGKRHTPKTNHGNRRGFLRNNYNNIGKPLKSSKNLRGNLQMFRIFLFFVFAFSFWVEFCSFSLLFESVLLLSCCCFLFSSVFQLCFFSCFPFPLFLYFFFFVFSSRPSRRQNPAKNCREIPDVKRTIFLRKFDFWASVDRGGGVWSGPFESDFTFMFSILLFSIIVFLRKMIIPYCICFLRCRCSIGDVVS